MDIHEKIKAARLAKNLSQGQVAQYVGLKSWQAVQQWENGSTRPRRKYAPALAELLDLDEVELMTGKADLNSWPFGRIDQQKIVALEREDLVRLETALLIVAADLGIDVMKGKGRRNAA